MIENYICFESFASPTVDRREVLRYAGVRESNIAIDELLDKCITEAEKKLVYKVCYREFDLSVNGDEINLCFASTRSC